MNKQPKPLTLTLNKEFRHAYYQGRSCATPYFVLYLARGRQGQCRYGITTSKKLGSAVQRNRARRLIRAAVWALSDELPPGKDLLFVSRDRILSAKSPEVTASLRGALKKMQREAASGLPRRRPSPGRKPAGKAGGPR